MREFSSIRASSTPKLQGEVRVPADKSLSHRAIMLASIAQGQSHIENFLFAEDNLATLNAFKAMGIAIDIDHPKKSVKIIGNGLHGLSESSSPLDMGNSGTAMRLLMGLLAGQRFSSCLVGDDSLSQRPMRRVADPLATMGAKIGLSDAGTAPIYIFPVSQLQGISYALPIASAQVKSALLLATLYAKGETSLRLPAVTRDHTERMLKAFGYPLQMSGNAVNLIAGHELKATHLKIPADISSAAFFMVAASVVPNSRILLRDVGINPTRTGVIHLLRLMGGDITLHNERFWGEEPVADIEIKSANLRGIDIPDDQVPLAIDELPVLMIAAACAKGITRLSGAAELRVKESDRIAAMEKGLRQLGICCEAQVDGIVINGGYFKGGIIDSVGDHRIAMAFAIAACVARSDITIKNCQNIRTSFPNFVELSQQIGCEIHYVENS